MSVPGAGDYVQETSLESTPENIQEASTFGISEPSYVYNALGNYVQGVILESPPPEASIFDYNALGNYVQGGILVSAPPEASTIGRNEPSYGYDGNYVQGGILESPPPEASTIGMNEPSYGYDVMGNYVQGGILEPVSGNTQEVSPFDINHEGNGYDASGAGDNGQEDPFGRRMLTDYNPTSTKKTSRPSKLMTLAPDWLSS